MKSMQGTKLKKKTIKNKNKHNKEEEDHIE